MFVSLKGAAACPRARHRSQGRPPDWAVPAKSSTRSKVSKHLRVSDCQERSVDLWSQATAPKTRGTCWEPPSCSVPLRQGAGFGAHSTLLMLDVAFPELVYVLVMWKQASKILALPSSRQLSFHNFRWSGQQSFVNPAVFSLSLQPAGVLQTPAFLLASRCLHQQSGSEQVDLNYRSPTEQIWPASPRQQKVASRVLRALEYALSEPPFLETLIKTYGVCIEEVRMSPDMLTAYVLWSGHPDCEEPAQNELQSRLSKIRVSVGKALKARHVPKLEFRLNQLTESQAAVEQELDRLKAGPD